MRWGGGHKWLGLAQSRVVVRRIRAGKGSYELVCRRDRPQGLQRGRTACPRSTHGRNPTAGPHGSPAMASHMHSYMSTSARNLCSSRHCCRDRCAQPIQRRRSTQLDSLVGPWSARRGTHEVVRFCGDGVGDTESTEVRVVLCRYVERWSNLPPERPLRIIKLGHAAVRARRQSQTACVCMHRRRRSLRSYHCGGARWG